MPAQTEIDALLPLDVHNRRLEANVHPRAWTNPTPTGRYNLVVVGAGTAGLVSAAGAAGLGGRVALIERSLTGGDCLNVGCVPSKALIRCARAVADVRDARAFGVRVDGDVRVDFGAVMERMRRLRADMSGNDSVHRFQRLGVDVFLGEGRFTGPDTVEVDGQVLRFARAVIATGARAATPPIVGLDEVGFLTNETVFSLTKLPERLAVIGGGPIGCELAQSFARFGSAVTLVEGGSRILGREDDDAARVVGKSLLRDGIRILTDCRVTRVASTPRGRVIHVLREGATIEVEADQILIGVGRAPNVEGMGLESAGVAYDVREGVRVDDRLRTTNRRVFAAGDVCSRFKFTHAADAMARIVIRNALFFGRARASALTIPRCTFTDPEIAHVGLTAGEASDAGVDVTTFVLPLSEIDRAILDGDDEGFLKVHLRSGSDRIVGATLVARHAGEMISELTLAMGAKIGAGGLAATIHPYPTQADAIRRIGEAYNRTKLTPRVHAVMSKILKWRR